MSAVHGQKNVFLKLLNGLRPGFRSAANLPAEIERVLKREKRFGSRDRRLYRELLYTTLRYLPWIEGLDDDTLVARVARLCLPCKATDAFRAAWAEPETVPLPSKTELLPGWFREECPEAFEEPLLSLLQGRAPLWLRLQTRDWSRVEREFADRGWMPTRSVLLPSAIRLSGEADVSGTQAYLEGRVEVQDFGSQLLLEAALPSRDGRWLDACAGAGGKTLQLASLLGSGSTVEASDVRSSALRALAQRAFRAGAELLDEFEPDRAGEESSSKRTEERSDWAAIRIVGDPEGFYDGVLVDAPCSGSGTWRRSPHLKWAGSMERIRQAAALQKKLLARYSTFVAPGGTLLYATCSLCRSENLAVVEAFVAENPDFELWPIERTFGYPLEKGTLTVWPQANDSDGLYVARLRRRV